MDYFTAFIAGRPVSAAEKRSARRRYVQCNGLIQDDQGSVLAQCFTTDVSASGAKLVIEKGINVPDEFVLILSRNAGVQRYCEVMWRAAKSIGVRFVAPPR